MIEPSLARFINAQAEFSAPGLALKAFSKSPDTVLSDLVAPFALVSPVTERAQELWVIGDAQRKENPIVQAAFYGINDEQRKQYEIRFRRLIESAKATDFNSLSHPGIDFLAFADLLRDSGDHTNYFADQPNWFASPAPVVYKNADATSVPTVLASGYSVDSTLGKVTLGSAAAASDIVRATYKVGVIDFNIVGVAKFEEAQESDVANNPQRFVVVFTLETHYYIKTTANRFL